MIWAPPPTRYQGQWTFGGTYKVGTYQIQDESWSNLSIAHLC